MKIGTPAREFSMLKQVFWMVLWTVVCFLNPLNVLLLDWSSEEDDLESEYNDVV